MEEYKDVLTDDEEQRKMLLHCEEETRKLYPDLKNLLWPKTTKPFPDVFVNVRLIGL